jgi:di/tricarboxylate transporter
VRIAPITSNKKAPQVGPPRAKGQMDESLLGLMAATPWHMWATFAILGWAMLAFATERLPLELISLSVVVAFLLLFQLAPLRDADGARIVSTADIFAGFADPALFTVMCLLVLAQAMFQSGTMELPTKYLMRALSWNPKLVAGGVLALALVTSAFVNDTPVVVMFLPIVAALASAGKIAPSRLMMPLSFLALLGGATTLIGSSTNILAAGVYMNQTGREIGFFDMTPMGVVIAGAGFLYLSTIGRLLLPHRKPDEAEGARDHKHFIAQFEIRRGSSLIGKQAVAGHFPDLPDVTVRMVQRRENAILPPFDDFRFQTGDVAIVAATRDALTALLKSRPEIIDSVLAEVALEDGAAVEPRTQLMMVEAVVAPGSRMIGRSVAQIGFHYQTHCVILGVERRSRMIRAELQGVRLEQGDVLLLLGAMEDIRALRADRDLLLLEWSMTGLPAARNAVLAGLIFLATVVAAATGLLPIAVAAPVGALVMLGFGCLNVRQAARAFDRRIYLLIGASLAMGLALEETGGAAFIGGVLAPIAEHFGPSALISAVFILAAVMTNLLSNNATAVLLTPIAISAARIAGIDPLPLALTVIYGANCPFATPIGYQTNLLVMTPGHYRFGDYLRVGVPMILVLWAVYSIVAPIYFRASGHL